MYFYVVAALAMLLASGKALARDFTEIVASGELRIAIASDDFLPWTGHGENNELLGFEVDIATKLAEDLGVTARFIERPFDDLIPSLLAREADVIISGLSITPQRARRVMFSWPYGRSDLELIVSTPAIPDGAMENSYDMQGMVVAVISNTTSEFYGRQLFINSEIKAYPDFNAARDAFLAGDVNGLVASKPYPGYLALYDPENYTVAGDAITSTVEAVAVHPENYRLLNYTNSWIQEAMASGFLEDATRHWFETLDWVDRVPGLREQIEDLLGEEQPAKQDNQ